MSIYYDGFGNVAEIKSTASDDVMRIVTGMLPKVYIYSDTAYEDVTKEDSSKGTIRFDDMNTKFELPIKFKLQGHASVAYPKHNFNVTFCKADESGDKQKIQFNSWYPTSKIHIKANYADRTMCKNSVGAKIIHDFVCMNYPQGAYGVIDSFPVIVYYNDEYMGCHTWNLPQDGKTYNFDDSKEQACTNLAYRMIENSPNFALSNWEYRGDEDVTDAMNAKLQVALNLIQNPANLTTDTVETVFDKSSLLNYMMVGQIFGNIDCWCNNWSLVTWDGQKWFMTLYDMDSLYNQGSTGNMLGNDSAQWKQNSFFQKILELYTDEIPPLYATFRNAGLNTETVCAYFDDFHKKWGWQNLQDDMDKWFPNGTRGDFLIGSLKTTIAGRFAYLDEMYNYSE